MATRFTPKKASKLKRGDVLALSGARVWRNQPCEFHKGGRWIVYRESNGIVYDDCFSGDYRFVTQERA